MRYSLSRWMNGWVLALVTVGFVSRAAAIVDPIRGLWQWPTEDGYLMMTIAENIALGHGMAVSDGLIATNGTQPLCTFIWAAAFALSPARDVAVRVVQGFELLIAISTALSLYSISRRWLREHPRGPSVAALAAAAWWASPSVLLHTMNCLETGMYALAVLWSVDALDRAVKQPPSWARVFALGLTLSWAFYARNDAVFLIGAVCLAYGWFSPRPGLRSWIEATVVGATTVLLAVPWLRYNLTFGHLTPISGISESHEAVFGSNLDLVPIKLFEYVTLFIPIPGRYESNGLVLGLCILALVAVAVGLRIRPRTNPLASQVVPPHVRLAVVLFGASLCTFYGTIFGAPHFVVRYLFPLSPFFALGWAAFILRIVGDDKHARLRLVAIAALTVASALVSAVHSHRAGFDNGHRAMVEFVEAHTDPSEWVASSQSGTLGFFHRRTYNLDGKVSPEALEARLEERIPEYVAEKQEIRYIVDWVGLEGWYRDFPVVREAYDLVLQDTARNLVVLERRTPAGPMPPTPAEP